VVTTSLGGSPDGMGECRDPARDQPSQSRKTGACDAGAQLSDGPTGRIHVRVRQVGKELQVFDADDGNGDGATK
jgi:hypothetical protein